MCERSFDHLSYRSQCGPLVKELMKELEGELGSWKVQLGKYSIN